MEWLSHGTRPAGAAAVPHGPSSDADRTPRGGPVGPNEPAVAQPAGTIVPVDAVPMAAAGATPPADPPPPGPGST